ncbi:zinc metalloprotease HtpX [Boudabousia liubingyangii]|uniref:Protease HtpX homolog n=1 Tax=Boudabousia liubingyangii TaxID=1921764 RepID=A0A1Q5PQ70_9ACTO|nr:zinc metalloprotease HtpX [Boudabousia liubingyangii]OKL49687.1 zinc metalloprotease HtpX [Boudabousia liubingyangii]
MHSHFNGLKTAMLIAVMIFLLSLIGWFISVSTGSMIWFWVMLVIGVVTTGWSYWNSDKLALRQMRAYQVSEAEAPALYRIVTELSQKAGKPMPTIWVSPQPQPNAFATGRNPEHAAVCCTEGILSLLDERELRGVLGHELMHVYNRDILTSSVSGAIAGVITSIGRMFMFSAMTGMGRGRRDQRSNPLGALLFAVAAPFAAAVIQLAVSRTREYDADEDGAKLTGDPLALASALKRLETGIPANPMPRNGNTEIVSHMMIANPFNMASLFSTHPPMEKRIRRLEEMAGY